MARMGTFPFSAEGRRNSSEWSFLGPVCTTLPTWLFLHLSARLFPAARGPASGPTRSHVAYLFFRTCLVPCPLYALGGPPLSGGVVAFIVCMHADGGCELTLRQARGGYSMCPSLSALRLRRGGSAQMKEYGPYVV